MHSPAWMCSTPLQYDATVSHYGQMLTLTHNELFHCIASMRPFQTNRGGEMEHTCIPSSSVATR